MPCVKALGSIERLGRSKRQARAVLTARFGFRREEQSRRDAFALPVLKNRHSSEMPLAAAGGPRERADDDSFRHRDKYVQVAQALLDRFGIEHSICERSWGVAGTIGGESSGEAYEDAIAIGAVGVSNRKWRSGARLAHALIRSTCPRATNDARTSRAIEDKRDSRLLDRRGCASGGLAALGPRYYKRIGLLTPQPRTGGQRRYDTTVFNVLAVIAFAKQRVQHRRNETPAQRVRVGRHRASAMAIDGGAQATGARRCHGERTANEEPAAFGPQV